MTTKYGKKKIWLDPDDVMKYGTDPEIVRRYKILDTEKARLNSIGSLAKYLDISNTDYQTDTHSSLADSSNTIFATNI